VSGLADAVREYVCRSMSLPDGRGLDPAAARLFLASLPPVLARCDEDIYDAPLAAEAYAFVHLVDRYRRFWDVLQSLLIAGALPVRAAPLDVLDIGTGPAPALYAVNDFLEELRTFASQTDGCEALCTPVPRLRSIESSRNMVRLVHNLSEFTGRPGPFWPDEIAFEGFDPDQARTDARLRRIDELMNEEALGPREATRVASSQQAEWAGVGRYHFCIFSNFLTQQSQVASLATEIEHVFRALKPRGLVVVVGGTGNQYPAIYDKLEEIAQRSCVQPLTLVPKQIKCRYKNREALEIKRLFSSVLERIVQVVPLEESLKASPALYP